ncbi:tRNA (adenine(22)-N(1))-methyltransferase TrmK [Candidatus Woesearchaeota archaeon]|nr:tRNA (adenine(22)-N(1))-methyltransferase TrmK [Candidatus Woesearchaeota archaeon]
MIILGESMEFQDTILRSVEQHPVPYLVKLKGLDYVMFPETFNPNYAKASLFLLDNLGVQDGDVVLDPFTGSGADAIFAVREGASRAVAIDKFTMPYLCARYNVHRLGLEDRVDVRQGDLFDVLTEDERFNLVIANPPFKAMQPHSDIAAALRDEEYATLHRFFSEVGKYLTDDGRIRMVFSDVGDMDLLQDLAKNHGFLPEVVNQTKYASSVRIEVYEMRREK